VSATLLWRIRHHLAEVCHEYGTKILIDAAQLAPHRSIDMKAQIEAGSQPTPQQVIDSVLGTGRRLKEIMGPDRYNTLFDDEFRRLVERSCPGQSHWN